MRERESGGGGENFPEIDYELSIMRQIYLVQFWAEKYSNKLTGHLGHDRR